MLFWEKKKKEKRKEKDPTPMKTFRHFLKISKKKKKGPFKFQHDAKYHRDDEHLLAKSIYRKLSP